MKKLLVLFYLLFFTLPSNADVLQDVSGKISEFASGLIPGEGHTEVSIDLREAHSPDFSILGVREIAPVDNGKFFTQFSLFNTAQPNGKGGGDERIHGNLGFGLRKLSDDNTLMFGINNFYDVDLEHEHLRTSLGLEARSAVLEFNYNWYEGLGEGYKDERVLGGSDFQLSSQVPYFHWASVFINKYEWKGELRDDTKGKKMGSEMMLTSNSNLEVAFDDKDKSGLDDEWYAKLQFFHPGKEGPTAQDGISDVAWKENRDMSDELLSKVKRQNKIVIEFKGTSTISRTD